MSQTQNLSPSVSNRTSVSAGTTLELSEIVRAHQISTPEKAHRIALVITAYFREEGKKTPQIFTLKQAIDFEEFLSSPDVDAEIDKVADSLQGHGTLPPYTQAKLQVATRGFNHDSYLVNALISFNDSIVGYTRLRDFSDDVTLLENRLLEESKMSLLADTGVLMGSKKEKVAGIIDLNSKLVGGDVAIATGDQSDEMYVQSMENMHYSSLDENDQGTYLMMFVEAMEGIRPFADIVQFWKKRVGE